MICERCGYSMPDGSLTCDNCGTYLGKYSSSQQATGVRAIRQGRVSASQPTLPSDSGAIHEYGDYDLSSVPLGSGSHARRKPATYGSSRPDTRRGVPVNARGRAPTLKRGQVRTHPVRRHSVNWMLVGLIVAVTLAILGGGGYYFIRNSDAGQRAAARRNAQAATEEMFVLAASDRDPLLMTAREDLLKQWNGVNAQAYWLAGQDLLDEGDVEMAIQCFRIADVVDPENYDGLLMLATAYELNADDENAEAVYLQMLEKVSSFRSEAYSALIRMYQNQERGPEAADMMLLAYQNTDRENFRLMREEYLPRPPEINLPSGRYQIDKLTGDVYLSSPQDYDIYYTVDDDAKLPEEGTLYESGRFEVKEGSVTLRAVCVSGDLVSDPLRVIYTFFYPTPPAPRCNLQPDTYQALRTVSLRPGEIKDDTLTHAQKEEMQSKFVFYYTIDGTTPTTDSPMYDGTPIKLPSGRVTLRAVCINEFGKMSSNLEVGYKFEVKPYPKEMYQETDTFQGFKLNATNIEEFTAAFGAPKETLETTYLSMTDCPARHLNYDWGHAVFILQNNNWQLVRVDMNRQVAKGPRGVGFGDSESAVTSVYKDFGQVASASGNRGLYHNYPSVGQVQMQKDGSKIIFYMCQTAASQNWVLQYWVKNDSVYRITHYYQP